MQSTQPSEGTPPAFSGKVVAFYLTTGSTSWGDSVVLDFIEFKEVGNRAFLVGRLPQAVGTEWIWGMQAGIAWDSVAHYLVFDSVEDYKQRANKTEPSFWHRLFNRRAG